MSNENFIGNLASELGQSASVKNVFGEPVTAGAKTIIPVAQIAYGFGGGHGRGYKRGKKKESKKTDEASGNGNDKARGEGAGGGGGMYAKAKGIYEITPTRTRFIPADNAKGICIGFIVKALFFSKKKIN